MYLKYLVVQCSGYLQFCTHCEPHLDYQALVEHAGHSQLHSHREKDLLAMVDCIQIVYVMGWILQDGPPVYLYIHAAFVSLSA